MIEVVHDEVKKLFKTGYIRTARYVDWISIIVLIIKKNGQIRVCIDFRDLNHVTPKDGYPMPTADDLVDKIARHVLMYFIDDFSYYNQIFIAEEDSHKTAFRCPFGIFELVVMSFGLKNAIATYPRAMNTIFHGQLGEIVQIYIDDIVVKSKYELEHLDNLRTAFEKNEST